MNVSRLPIREPSEDSAKDDKQHRSWGKLSTQVQDQVVQSASKSNVLLHLPRERNQKPAGSRRSQVVQEPEWEPGLERGYIEISGVTGIVAGVTFALFTRLIAPPGTQFDLDFLTTLLTGAVVGCMFGSLLGCLFASAANELK